jgi:hypothetical protein
MAYLLGDPPVWSLRSQTMPSDATAAKQNEILANQRKILANQKRIEANQKKLDQIIANQKKILSKIS